MNNQFYYKNNRIQQLRGFYNVVQHGSISAAAKKMNLTQSAVSQQINSLERDVNVNLLDRTSKGIKLTKEGKIFYSQSVHFIQGINDLFESFSEYISNKKLDKIRIASNHVGISYILPKYIKKYKDQNPNQEIEIYNLSIEECEAKLLNKEIDFFIYPQSEKGVKDEFEFIPIVKYNAIVLMNKENRLSKKKKVKLEDIAKENLLRIDPHLITLPCFEELITTHKVDSSIKLINSDWEILKKYVKNNLGVAIVSSIVLEGENESEFIKRDLSYYFPPLNYGIFYKKSIIIHDNIKEIIDIFKKNQILEAQY